MHLCECVRHCIALYGIGNVFVNSWWLWFNAGWYLHKYLSPKSFFPMSTIWDWRILTLIKNILIHTGIVRWLHILVHSKNKLRCTENKKTPSTSTMMFNGANYSELNHQFIRHTMEILCNHDMYLYCVLVRLLPRPLGRTQIYLYSSLNA